MRPRTHPSASRAPSRSQRCPSRSPVVLEITRSSPVHIVGSIRLAAIAAAAPSIASAMAPVRSTILAAHASVPEHDETVATGPWCPETHPSHPSTPGSCSIASEPVPKGAKPIAAQETKPSGVETPSSAKTELDPQTISPRAHPEPGNAPAMPTLSTPRWRSGSSTRAIAPLALALPTPVWTRSILKGVDCLSQSRGRSPESPSPFVAASNSRGAASATSQIDRRGSCGAGICSGSDTCNGSQPDQAACSSSAVRIGSSSTLGCSSPFPEIASSAAGSRV
jgi:hypothetical protein